MSPQFIGVVTPAGSGSNEDKEEVRLDPSSPPSSVAPLCWKRKQKVNMDRNMALLLAFEDHCIACGKQELTRNKTNQVNHGKKSPSPGVNGKSGSPTGRAVKNRSDYDHCLQRVTSLSSDELTATLMASLSTVTAGALKQIPCIGCRTAITELSRNVEAAADAIEPLVVVADHGENSSDDDNNSIGSGTNEDRWLAVNRHHLVMPAAIARLLTDELCRLESDFNDNMLRPSERARSGTFRCHVHTSKRHSFSDRMWREQWDAMAPICREAVLSIPFEKLKSTVEIYLRKHKFCHECTNMVYQALGLLTGGGENNKDSARGNKHRHSSGGDHHHHHHGDRDGHGDGEHDHHGHTHCGTHRKSPEPHSAPKREKKCCCCDGPTLKRNAIYEGLTGDTKTCTVRVKVDEVLVGQLIEMAIPEINGDQTEKHAKTLEIAQKEICICIGMALYNRFRDCQMGMREGVQTADLLLLMALKTLKYQLDMAYEAKTGNGGLRSVELLVEELEDGERRKKLKREKKSEKKAKQKAKRRQQMVSVQEERKENVTPPPPEQQRQNNRHSPTPEYDFSKRINLIDLFDSTSPESEDELCHEEAIPAECIEEYQRNMEQVKRKIEEIHCRLEQDWNARVLAQAGVNHVRETGKRVLGDNGDAGSRRR